MTQSHPTNRNRSAQLYFSAAQKEAVRAHCEILPNDGGLPCGRFLGAHLLFNLKDKTFVEYTSFSWLDSYPAIKNGHWPLTDNDFRTANLPWLHFHDPLFVSKVKEDAVLPILFGNKQAHLALATDDSIFALLGKRRALKALRHIRASIQDPSCWPTFYETDPARPLSLLDVIGEKRTSLPHGHSFKLHRA